MVTVAAGDRLVLRTAAGTRLAVRALHATELVGSWRLRVLAPAGRVAAVAGVLELAAPAGGTVRLPARLAIAEGALVLEAGRAGEPTGTFTPVEGQQRRDDVRGEVHLPVRVAAVDGRAEQALRGAVLVGHTLDVSAGGARLALRGTATPPEPGARLYVEVELPDGDLAPAVVAVVAGENSGRRRGGGRPRAVRRPRPARPRTPRQAGVRGRTPSACAATADRAGPSGAVTGHGAPVARGRSAASVASVRACAPVRPSRGRRSRPPEAPRAASARIGTMPGSTSSRPVKNRASSSLLRGT